MRIKLYTIVDITETKARRNDDKKSYSQQCNFNTVLQTVGLRVNINPISCKEYVDLIDDLGFGKSFVGKQRYWEFTFDVEYEGGTNETLLATDFDLIPVITDLNETANINNHVFRTSCPNDRNIVFKITSE
jgi:hypothetical protein